MLIDAQLHCQDTSLKLVKIYHWKGDLQLIGVVINVGFTKSLHTLVVLVLASADSYYGISHQPLALSI